MKLNLRFIPIFLFGLLICPILFLPIGEASLADSAWPMYSHDARHTSLSNVNTTSNTGQLKWKFNEDCEVVSSPSIGTDGTLYFGCYSDSSNKHNTKIYALTPEGKKKWEIETYKQFKSTPAVDSNGTIYFTSIRGNIFAISDQGIIKWIYNVSQESPLTSPTIGKDGIIYTTSQYGHVIAINPDGKEIFNVNIGEFYQLSSPAIGNDGILYISANNMVDLNGYLFSLYPNGTLKWQNELWTPAYASPAINSNGTIIVGEGSYNGWGYLTAITPTNITLWRNQFDGPVEGTPAIRLDGTIYTNSGYDDDRIHYVCAISSDGIEKWRYGTRYMTSFSTPAVDSNGIIYIGESEFGDGHGSVYGFYPNGTLKWQFLLNESIRYYPTLTLT